MLSRVCCLLHLIILGKLSPDKIKADPKVISAARRMEDVSVNKTPSRWNSNIERGSRISLLNVRPLKKDIEDVRKDPLILSSDVICVQETWLEPEEDENVYQIEGYTTQLNSHGRGKGVAIYMGGLALMVISPKNWEFSHFFKSTLGIIQPHLKSISDFI